MPLHSPTHLLYHPTPYNTLYVSYYYPTRVLVATEKPGPKHHWQLVLHARTLPVPLGEETNAFTVLWVPRV